MADKKQRVVPEYTPVRSKRDLSMQGNQLNRLIELMNVQTASYNEKRMRRYIRKVAESLGCKVQVQNSKPTDNKDKRNKGFKNFTNLYITKGEAELFPCVVAHMDTVHQIFPEPVVYHDSDDLDILWAYDTKLDKQVGIGGDDKVGIFIALEMLRKFDNIKVAFFSNEEVGCIGSNGSKLDFFKDCSFVLECDRKGYGDFVHTISGNKLYSDEFEEAILPTLESFGYEPTRGGLTDVGALKDNGLDICCANMSCGYYKPHTDEEYIRISEVNLVCEMVDKLITDFGYVKRWEHTKPAPQPYTRNAAQISVWDDLPGGFYSEGMRNGVSGFWRGGEFFPWGSKTYMDGETVKAATKAAKAIKPDKDVNNVVIMDGFDEEDTKVLSDEERSIIAYESILVQKPTKVGCCSHCGGDVYTDPTIGQAYCMNHMDYLSPADYTPF